MRFSESFLRGPLRQRLLEGLLNPMKIVCVLRVENWQLWCKYSDALKQVAKDLLKNRVLAAPHLRSCLDYECSQLSRLRMLAVPANDSDR
jgi:hypothetical protein